MRGRGGTAVGAELLPAPPPTGRIDVDGLKPETSALRITDAVGPDARPAVISSGMASAARRLPPLSAGSADDGDAVAADAAATGAALVCTVADAVADVNAGVGAVAGGVSVVSDAGGVGGVGGVGTVDAVDAIADVVAGGVDTAAECAGGSATRRTVDAPTRFASSLRTVARPSIGRAGSAAERPEANRATFTAGRISPV
jgi:hypothetical protein